mgnify:CR=1 FL=1
MSERKDTDCSDYGKDEKKAVYIIPEIDREHYIEISKEDIDSYQIDFNNKKNIIKKWDKFFALPENGEVKPVFYIWRDGRLYFGYTPRLRLFYKHSVKEGLKQGKVNMDFAKAMFGYANDASAYKSR